MSASSDRATHFAQVLASATTADAVWDAYRGSRVSLVEAAEILLRHAPVLDQALVNLILQTKPPVASLLAAPSLARGTAALYDTWLRRVLNGHEICENQRYCGTLWVQLLRAGHLTVHAPSVRALLAKADDGIEPWESLIAGWVGSALLEQSDLTPDDLIVILNARPRHGVSEDIATHPAATPKVWREIFDRGWQWDAAEALADHPPAMQDPETRRTVVKYAVRGGESLIRDAARHMPLDALASFVQEWLELPNLQGPPELIRNALVVRPEVLRILTDVEVTLLLKFEDRNLRIAVMAALAARTSGDEPSARRDGEPAVHEAGNTPTIDADAPAAPVPTEPVRSAGVRRR